MAREIQFADPAAAAAQGLSTGIGQGIQLGMQAREQRWQKLYQKAAVAMPIVADKNMPASLRLKAANNGLLPILQDGQLGIAKGQKVEPFTEADLENPLFQDTMSKIMALNKNADMNPKVKAAGANELILGYLAASGQEKEALDFATKMITDEGKVKEPDVYSPEQLAAMEAQDPEAMDKAFGGKIPKDAVGKMLSYKRAEGLETERGKVREDKFGQKFIELGEKIERNPILKQLKERDVVFDDVGELLDLMDAGNTLAYSALGLKVAKAFGEVGVMTEEDIKRYVQSGKLTQSAADKVLKWQSGAPSEATAAELREITSAIQDSAARKVQPIYDKYIDRAVANYGVTHEEAAQRLGIPWSGKKGGAAPKGGGTSAPAKKDKKPTNADEYSKSIGL